MGLTRLFILAAVWNITTKESGEVWLKRMLNHFEQSHLAQSQPEQYWSYHHSIGIIQSIMENRMFPLTLDGISDGIKQLT